MSLPATHLRLPERLMTRLKRDAAERGCTLSEVIRAALADHYGDPDLAEMPRASAAATALNRQRWPQEG